MRLNHIKGIATFFLFFIISVLFFSYYINQKHIKYSKEAHDLFYFFKKIEQEQINLNSENGNEQNFNVENYFESYSNDVNYFSVIQQSKNTYLFKYNKTFNQSECISFIETINSLDNSFTITINNNILPIYQKSNIQIAKKENDGNLIFINLEEQNKDFKLCKSLDNQINGFKTMTNLIGLTSSS